MRTLKALAFDLALATALMALLLAGTPAAPVWFGLLAEDIGAVRLFEPSMLGLFLVLVFVARSLRGLAAVPWKRRALDFVTDQNGALVLEFALIFPFIMALVFILFQWAEVLMADGLVHYASFAAARAAITYANVAGSTPEQPQGQRWQVGTGECKKAMERAATAALMGAYVIEGGMQHDTVKVNLVDPSLQNALKDDPSDGKGGYKLVHVKVEWGFIPRWPMSFLFFRPILKDKRILIEGQYAMQVEGYYRSPSLNQRSNAATEGDTYANGQQPPPQNSREGEIQKALYERGGVLPEGHNPQEAVSGTRDDLGRNCN